MAGREVVVLGRGATLGRPLAMLLGQKRPTADAAVTVVHTGGRTGRGTPAGPTSSCRRRRAGDRAPRARATGCRRHRGGVRYAGRRLLPDVDEACAEVASAITPRVGGVGPTTVAVLFRNAVLAAGP